MEKIQKTLEPKNRLSYNRWCKKFKVGSRCEKYEIKKYFEEGEYDYEKFIKIIKSYGEEKKQESIYRKISETFFTLCKGKMQKAWNKINIA